MSDEKKGFLRYLSQAWLVLALAIVFGVALAWVEGVTHPRIRQNQVDLIARRLVEMFGEGTTTSEPAGVEATVQGRARTIECYPAIRRGRQVGWGILAEGRGYDDLLLLIGVDRTVETIRGYRVIKSLETPGIGDRIEKPEFYRQFEGKRAAEPLACVASSVSPAGQQVNAISGATISSRGVVKTINDSLAAVRDRLKALAAEAE